MSKEAILKEMNRLTEVLETIGSDKIYVIRINGITTQNQAIQTTRDIGIEIKRLMGLLKEYM